ncbi:uncharacterized protein GGS25DRAFT_489407 [Hypoxylon fragiforme]|uniref:uncharacterized protein n=1 Tax=Hypoxylon fragiforme TaxID=63214 RepID=UPI0020C6337E|nr:uncharacterized protein GGS25DRAFT_489407 [Hypoxylon fragiforme]KAI2608248.1 hypothetical protein GGS25DRAFT_489407 [Hypoxylon fragiforme]
MNYLHLFIVYLRISPSISSAKTKQSGDDPSRPHCVTYLYDVDFFENLNGYSFLACGEDAGSSTIATSPLPGWTPTSDPTTADQSTSGVSLSTSGPVTVTIFPSESPTPPTRPDAPARSTSSGQNRAGAIAGGVIGGLAGLALIGAAIFFLLRHRRRKTQEGKEYAGSPPYTSRDFPAASVYPGGIPEPYYNSDFYGELPPQMIDTSTQHIASYPPPTSLDPIVIPRDSRDTQHSQNTHTHTHAHTHNTQSQQPRMSSHARPSTYVPPLQQQRQPTAADDIVSPITPGDPLNPADDPASYTWISNPTPPPPQQQQHHQSASEYSEFSPPPPAHFQTYRPYSGT